MNKQVMLGACVWVCLAACGFGAGQCAPVSEKRSAELRLYIQRKYKLPDDVRLTIAETSFVAGTCYRKLHFVASGKRNFDANLFLTPDQMYLTAELNNIQTDPIAEERARHEKLRLELERAEGRPVLGPANAPVSLVVFSDFQCPYCARFAETMRQVAAEEKQVRVIFVNLPLEMHAWAKPAAETAACVQSQSNEGFWRVHDYLFQHQREITAANVQQRLMQVVGSLSGVRAETVRQCVDKHLALARIQKDMALATAAGVHGTPSVFVNGEAAGNGAPAREHLLTLIREHAGPNTRAAVNRPVR